MGCAQTRTKTEEQGIEASEAMLKFQNLTIPHIKQAFFQLHATESISKEHLLEVLKELELEYNHEENEALDRFLSAFFLFEEDDVEHYDLIELLSVLFLLSKSSQREKAACLFDIFDEEGAGELDRLKFETELYRLIDTIFSYSEKLLDNEEEVVYLHKRITAQKKERIMSDMLEYFMGAQAKITRREFVKLTQKSSSNEALVDFTSPQSIRAKFMDYAQLPTQTKIELQQNYKVRMSSRLTSFFSQHQNHDLRTQTNSPMLTPRLRTFEEAEMKE